MSLAEAAHYNPVERRKGNTRGNPRNLRGGQYRTGKLKRVFTIQELLARRSTTMDRIGLQVEALVDSTEASVGAISRAIGRDFNRILPSVLAGNDCKLKTLIDLAAVCGHRLEVTFVPENAHPVSG